MPIPRTDSLNNSIAGLVPLESTTWPRDQDGNWTQRCCTARMWAWVPNCTLGCLQKPKI